ncbi:MAG TPA: glycosyltransferase family 39 protein [Tepidisphaeraceae bacterium]|nr:glycosyltransferase family 39 protein [Tepidisphaeraceae bacterium]
MTKAARPRFVMAVLMFVAAGVFLTGINWGLPSRWVDPYLFGNEPVWSGEKLLSLAPPSGGALGADVDANPLTKRSYPIVLNDRDEKRAEIIRRYRLFSHQPDEMITFMALSRINQHHGDPRLYQYGGLWIYPVGAMLKLADIVGFIDLRGGPEGQAYYLDHPESFGRFYIVARLYTVLWGLVGVWAVFWIVRRLTGSDLAAATGALCYTFMPVVVNMAHEAKPHLPGAVLMLLSAVAATKYVETGRTRWWIAAGALCGAAFGMVLSSLVCFAIIPVMVLLRKDDWERRVRVAVGATAVGFMIYLATNPYVLINAIVAPEILKSNLENSTAMYGRRGLGGLWNAIVLLGAGTSPPLLIAGVLGTVWLIHRGLRPCRDVCTGSGDVGWLLLAPAALIAIQFALLAEGKPGEYARFAIFTDIALAIAAVAAADGWLRAWLRPTVMVLLVMVTAVWGVPYILGFVADSGPGSSRRVAAETIAAEIGDVAVIAEPAPYAVPPVDLFARKLVLIGTKNPPLSGHWYVRASDTSDRLFDTPISWANKPMYPQKK